MNDETEPSQTEPSQNEIEQPHSQTETSFARESMMDSSSKIEKVSILQQDNANQQQNVDLEKQ